MIRPPPRSTLFPSTTLFRSSLLLRAYDQPHVLAARARGLGSSVILCRHILPLAAPPLPSPLARAARTWRSEEHTSELQSHLNLVCRLLLEKKKQTCSCVTAR